MTMTTRPEVVNRHRIHPVAGDVYIGRPGPFGNPFVIGRDGSREEVIDKFRAWLDEHPEILSRLSGRKPKRLVCFCAPEACHGDVYADELEKRWSTNGESSVEYAREEES